MVTRDYQMTNMAFLGETKLTDYLVLEISVALQSCMMFSRAIEHACSEGFIT
jgi:hypothetical protein